MKPQELLLASAVIALIAGVGTSLAARALQDRPARAAAETPNAAPAAATEAPTAAADSRRVLDDLRLENAALRERLSAVEARLAEVTSTRTPIAHEDEESATPELALRAADGASPQAVAVDDDFVASVGRAMDEIKRREDAAREQKRKDVQAVRVEERVAKLQQELGLTSRQASDMRTALITADDKREALFDTLRDSEGDPRDMRDGFCRESGGVAESAVKGGTPSTRRRDRRRRR